MASASGAAPSVITVRSSRRSTYSVSGCSPAIGTTRKAPCSSCAVTSYVDGRAASLRIGRYGASGAFTSPADVRHLDLRQRRRRGGAQLRVAIAAQAPQRGDGAREALVVGTLAQHRAQVVADRAEQARVHLAVGRQPRAGAVAAERLRDRGDDADLAAPVAITPALGDLAGVRGRERLDRQHLVDA